MVERALFSETETDNYRFPTWSETALPAVAT